MIVMLLLAVVLGLVFFKLGVLTVWFGVLQGLLKLLFVLSGAFLVVAAWRWIGSRYARETHERQCAVKGAGPSGHW